MKKIEKDLGDFWLRKLTLKVKLWLVWQLAINQKLKIQYFLILYPLFENSTTCIAILISQKNVGTSSDLNSQGLYEERLNHRYCNVHVV